MTLKEKGTYVPQKKVTDTPPSPSEVVTGGLTTRLASATAVNERHWMDSNSNLVVHTVS